MYKSFILLAIYFCGCQTAVDIKPEPPVIEPPQVKKNNPRLDNTVFEMRRFLDIQEKMSKSRISDKCSGKVVKGRPTLVIVLSDEFQERRLSDREGQIEKFYQFWKLRSQANGLSADVVLELVHDGVVLGYVDLSRLYQKEFWLLRPN